ncbi:site-2 protease family protein [Deinococcus sp. UR1]|uniref:site-2 protease family protein n=1 Tax=Deinococcus sp. UR1 TaxID=1704277 RepID=UPI0006DCAB77|nr:site-2 protease family protein [Deinococcus sp. UR1]PIG97856.1 site-2 protease family protein [Deinococcus sp. UR1]
MGLISLLSSNPTAFVIIAAALVLSLTFHEFAHAYTADRLGDPTPRRYGRVTLNPIKHLDPFGTLLMLLVGFGFARPVPINPNNLGRWGTMWVSAAGPLSNLLIAVVCAVLLKVLPLTSLTYTILMTVLSINVVLAVFNLIPIPLLDGSRILGAIVPSLGRALNQFEAQPFSFLIVMGFILLFQGQIGGIIRTVQAWVIGFIGV